MGTYSKLRKLSKSQPPAGRAAPKPKPPEKKPEENHTASRTADNTAINTASSTVVLPLDAADLTALKEKTYLPRTFKMSDRDTEWLEDTVYRLSKELKPRKVFQVDVVRIGMKLFENLLASNKQEVLKILRELR